MGAGVPDDPEVDVRPPALVGQFVAIRHSLDFLGAEVGVLIDDSAIGLGEVFNLVQGALEEGEVIIFGGVIGFPAGLEDLVVFDAGSDIVATEEAVDSQAGSEGSVQVSRDREHSGDAGIDEGEAVGGVGLILDDFGGGDVADGGEDEAAADEVTQAGGPLAAIGALVVSRVVGIVIFQSRMAGVHTGRGLVQVEVDISEDRIGADFAGGGFGGKGILSHRDKEDVVVMIIPSGIFPDVVV